MYLNKGREVKKYSPILSLPYSLLKRMSYQLLFVCMRGHNITIFCFEISNDISPMSYVCICMEELSPCIPQGCPFNSPHLFPIYSLLLK